MVVQLRIISAILKALERCFSDLSDVQHIQLNRGTNQGSCWSLQQLNATSDLVSGPQTSGLMNPPTVTSPAH